MAPDLTCIVLTYNEEIHIERCLRSLEGVAHQVFVVDSFSTDKTVDLAKDLGAVLAQRPFINQADQFQWALDHYVEYCGQATEWIMRLDADEHVTPALREEIRRALPAAASDVAGFIINLCVHFKGHQIRHGGHYLRLLRLWRDGKAKIEASWMDEHMVAPSGRVLALKEEIHENNLNHITWWTDKHNRYASREAVDLLNKRYCFLPESREALAQLRGQAKIRRWLKDRLYTYLPLGWRAFFFYLYRMVFRLGFLDGRAGMAFHFLQGFWYRFLVDMKVWEVEHYMRDRHVGCVQAIRDVLGIHLEKRA